MDPNVVIIGGDGDSGDEYETPPESPIAAARAEDRTDVNDQTDNQTTPLAAAHNTDNNMMTTNDQTIGQTTPLAAAHATDNDTMTTNDQTDNQTTSLAAAHATNNNTTTTNNQTDNQTTPLAAAHATNNDTRTTNDQTNSQTTPLVPSAHVETNNQFQWKYDMPRYGTEAEIDATALGISSTRASTRLTQNVANMEHSRLIGQGDTFAEIQTKFRLPDALLRGLADMGITKPTRVQKACIEEQFHAQTDMSVRAPLGSGKMLAYLIPLVSFLIKAKPIPASSKTKAAQPRGLIVTPTHETAIQIFEHTIDLCKYTHLRPCVVYGNTPVEDQKKQLKLGCDILIGTLGRLWDFSHKPETLLLGSVKIFIVNEADEMGSESWDQGFKKLFASDFNISDDMSTWLLSSEIREGVTKLEDRWLDYFTRINLHQDQDYGLELRQDFVYCETRNRIQEMGYQIRARPRQRTLIIVNNRATAERIGNYLYVQNRVPTGVIHGSLSQQARETSKTDFDLCRMNFCIVTGALARDLNFNQVNQVVLFDLPRMSDGGLDEYIVRIGRTGRMGDPGQIIAFVGKEDDELAPDLVRYLKSRDQPVPQFLQEAADRRAWSTQPDTQ